MRPQSLRLSTLALASAALLSLLLSGCGSVVDYHREVITPVSRQATVAKATAAIDSYLRSQKYRVISDRNYAPTFHGMQFEPLVTYGRFRGGEFRLFRSGSSIMLVSWYAYVPPLGSDSPEYHRVSAGLFQKVHALPGYTYQE